MSRREPVFRSSETQLQSVTKSQRFQTELKEAFDLFDFDKDKKIAIEEVGLVIRSSGLDPTTESLDRILSEIKQKGGKVDINGLVTLIDKYKLEPTSVEELREAFQIFNKEGNRQVNLAEFKHSVTLLAERLKDEEVDKLLREVDPNGEGVCDYEDIINVIKST